MVLVHGGPHGRGGDWQWRAEPRFLASRGDLVLEPEFRGSTGDGGTLFHAGWKQWGLKSQDDMADALAWMAVTDIGLMFDLNDSDLPQVWRQHGMPALMGDPVKDAAQLATTSPLQQAGRLQRPLPMAVGGVDQRVPITHGQRFKDALPAGYTGLTWLVYPDEGHGFGKPQSLVDFWQQVEAFLARELAPR